MQHLTIKNADSPASQFHFDNKNKREKKKRKSCTGCVWNSNLFS